MCLLTYFPEGVQPDLDALYAGAELNNDGHGFAMVTHRGLFIKRGMDAKNVIERFGKARAQYPDGPALFHSRFGTGGTVNRFNCHPFHFSNDRSTIVAHNGVLPPAGQPGQKDRRCDTRYAAEEIIPFAFGHLSHEASRKALSEWIGKYNKLVILTVNPDYPVNSYIINESSGEWDDGIWYSNSGYKWYSKSYYSYPEWKTDECEYCGSTGLGTIVKGHCTWCETCQDCGKQFGVDCDCHDYAPDNSDDDDGAAALAAWFKLKEATEGEDWYESHTVNHLVRNAAKEAKGAWSAD